MAADFFLDQLGIVCVVADDILQMQQIFGSDPDKLEARFTISGADNFPEHLDARSHPGQENGESALLTQRQVVLDFQEAATDAQVDYPIDRVNLVTHLKPSPHVKNYPAEPPFLFRHGLSHSLLFNCCNIL